MKTIKNITKVLNGQKEVAVRVTYADDTVQTFNVSEGETANDVLAKNVRNGNISLKGYNTNKRVIVEQTVPMTETEEAIRIAKRKEEAREEAMKSAAKLNAKYSDVANFRVNVNAFDDNNQPKETVTTAPAQEENNKNISRRSFVLGVGSVVLLGALVWGGCKLSKGANCASVSEVSKAMPTATSYVELSTPEPVVVKTAVPTVAPTAVPTAEPTAVPTAEPTAEPTAVPTAEPTAVPTAEPTAVPTAEPTPVVEETALAEEYSGFTYDDAKLLVEAGYSSPYVAKCGYTRTDIENVICNLHGLAMINTDCRVTDPYKLEQFFNDMTTEAIENFFNTGKIVCYNYSALYEEGSVECEALKNIEQGFEKVTDNESAQDYFAKCYRVSQGLAVDNINVLQATNEQFEGPFYYAVADRAMLYNMTLGESLKIRAGLIWYDLGDEYKNIPYDTEELYNENGVMEGLRLDWIHNELARCSEDAKVLSRK